MLIYTSKRKVSFRHGVSEDFSRKEKTMVVGAAVAIIVGTIVEDFLTAGVGVADDVQSVLLAYKLIRIVRKIPV
jgi:hypothetical protein